MLLLSQGPELRSKDTLLRIDREKETSIRHPQPLDYAECYYCTVLQLMPESICIGKQFGTKFGQHCSLIITACLDKIIVLGFHPRQMAAMCQDLKLLHFKSLKFLVVVALVQIIEPSFRTQSCIRSFVRVKKILNSTVFQTMKKIRQLIKME